MKRAEVVKDVIKVLFVLIRNLSWRILCRILPLRYLLCMKHWLLRHMQAKYKSVAIRFVGVCNVH